MIPTPTRERWQPLRSGFVNLYRYDCEEFHYENGRLLLRGNNGTGKSRVLALQLPFLLDGEVSPQRLEPDADPSKRIEWNLLMDRYPDRTGYTWIEFGRLEEDGAREHFLTLGCGLSAVQGRAGARQWFFITTQRIGLELELVTDAKQVIGKDRLRERIGASGRVFESAGLYRRAVNEALFRLDEYRYASLMNLLIQLRRPQLTRQLDEQQLSRALSEALPPVSSAVIVTVAEAFSNLQSDRGQLDSSKTALAAVEQFLTGYRLYSQVAAKRRAERVLAAHYEYEAGMKEILTAEAECDRSLAELARLKTEMQRLADEEHALEAEIAAFQHGPEMKDARVLEQAHRDAVERRQDAERAAADLVDATRARKSSEEEHLRLRTHFEQCRLRAAAATDAAQQAAFSAGLEFDLKQSRDETVRLVQTQIEKLAHARRLDEHVESAKQQLQRSSAERDQLSGLLDDARERLNTARAEHQSAITAFLGAVSDWTADLRELPLPYDEGFLKSVSDWCDRPHGPNPFATASRNAVEEWLVNFAERRAEARLDVVLEVVDELNRRENALRSEAHAAPAGDELRAAYEHSVAVARHVESLRARVTEAEELVKQKQVQVDQSVQTRAHALADLRIAKWGDDRDSLQAGIVNYRLALASLWPAIDSLEQAQASCECAWTNVEKSTAREARQRELADDLDRRSVAAEIARDATGHVAAGDFDEILRRISRARQRLDQLRVEEKETRRRYHDTEVAVTRVDERLRNRTEILTGQTDRRETAAASLRTFASTGLMQLAVSGIAGEAELKASTLRTVEAAFDLVSRLASIDAGDSAWEQQQKSVPSQFSTLMQTLSAQGCRSSATFRDDVFVAAAVFAGRERLIDELRQILIDDVADRQRLLDAREREILENHLIGTVATHLCDLLHSAEEQVTQMNVELESRPMSTGMKLRFVWRPAEDAPPGMAEARQRLMQINEAWSPVDRQMLGLFLHQQIKAACADTEGATWQESLASALDYRRWHWFGVERFQDGVWKRLTRRTHGTGSGGEKAVALTLPHFAAAAAFYRTAQPLAPRLILLDEAFVGIDADMRAKCMGLIHTFDLDFIMTSEREWGCYQTLPGIAIYQLSTRPGIDAVGLTRWVWNGRQRSLYDAVAENAESLRLA